MRYLLIVVALFTLSMGYAQTKSHNTNCMHCRYSKSYIANKPKDSRGGASNECGCAVCGEQKQKEQATRAAEKKRMDDAIAAQNKAKAEADQKRMHAERMALLEKQKSTEVLINNTSGSNTKTVTTEPKKKLNAAKGLLYSNSGTRMFGTLFQMDRFGPDWGIDYFITGKDTILKGKFNKCISLDKEETNDYQFPDNLGIAMLKQTKRIRNEDIKIYDLVNAEGTRLLNDDNITFIMHFYGNWFVLLKGYPTSIGSGNERFYFDDVEIYNIKTKESYPLQKTNGRVENIWYMVNHETYVSNAGRSDYSRPTGTYKAAMRTGTRDIYMYYLTNEDTIEYDTK